MVTVCFIVCLGLFGFFLVNLIKAEKKKDDEKSTMYAVVMIVFAFVSCMLFIWVCILMDTVATSSTIDKKIAMYEEENLVIENSIEELVKMYMDYESKTYTEFKQNDAMSLVSYIPELKADALVLEQIETYRNNRQKIVQLKEERIDVVKSKWKLYFGN